MLKQLSIYAENKKGTLEHITAILLEHDINILGSMTDDGAEYGVNRMVVSSPDVAMSALTQAGYLFQHFPFLFPVFLYILYNIVILFQTSLADKLPVLLIQDSSAA